MANLKKSMILMIVCICFFISASCVFAADSIQSDDVGLADADDNGIDLDVEQDLGVDENDELNGLELGCGLKENNADDASGEVPDAEVLGLDNGLGETDVENATGNVAEVLADAGSENTVPETYNDLRDDIENLHDGDVYNIQKNYVIEDCDSELSKNRAINIYADNVVINGNGYSINANGDNGYFAVFKIIGNNVTLVNLNIVNSRAVNNPYSSSRWNTFGDDYAHVASPVEWYGDNGVINKCRFIDNAGEDGGAVYWVGNNGAISNCDFEGNAAVHGGAIFIGGNDNTISNSMFINSYSENSDVIFIKNFEENGQTLTLNVKGAYFLLKPENINEYAIEGSCVVMSGGKQIYPEITEEQETPDEITVGSYEELRNMIFDLKEGDVLNLTKDYYFEEGNHFYAISANNVIINGNGHKIHANDPFRLSLIWVNGNNVTVNGIIFECNQNTEGCGVSYVEWTGENGTLTNCTFTGNYAEDGGAVKWTGKGGHIKDSFFIENYAVNGGAVKWTGRDGIIESSYFIGNYADNGGAVRWSGKNGVVKDSYFDGSYAENGGAITWTGSSGVIKDCLFVNNTADISGGAIFIKGKSNLISNSLLWESTSNVLGESIFIDYRRSNLTLENVVFNEGIEIPIFDEGIVGTHLDASQIIGNNYYRWIGGTSYEITELIYNSIIHGGVNYLNDGSYYYNTYYEESGDFIFSVHSSTFAKYNIDYVQKFHFTGIYNSNFMDVFKKLWANNYETSFDILETVYVSCADDYMKALGEFYMPENIWNVEQILEGDYVNANNVAEKNPLTFGMNVVFTTFVSLYGYNIPWDMRLGWFDVLNIDGHGSYISGSYDKTEEEKWVILGEGDVFSAYNLTISGFNTAVENMGGQCVFYNMVFSYNKMDYWIQRDWGAAILNTGLITCVNCDFSNNFAKNGGAIFNQGMLVLQDCYFSGNKAYGEGDDICIGDGGQIVVDGVSITGNGQCSIVEFPESMSLTESTLVTMLCVATSFIVGTFVGLLTANAALGIIAGGAVGALIGTAGAAWIISEHYDVNFDRMTTLATLVCSCAGAGALGGTIGGVIGQLWSEELAWVMANGGPENAWVGNQYTWGELLTAMGIGTLISSDVVGITYYCTND